MESQSVRVFLELPGELVVMEVPKLIAVSRIAALDAVQLPFPPPYDFSGKGVVSMTTPYEYRRERIDPAAPYEPQQLPCPPPYDQ